MELSRISIDGKPVIGGTRISIDLLLELVGAGLSVDDILREYPDLKREDVVTVLYRSDGRTSTSNRL